MKFVLSNGVLEPKLAFNPIENVKEQAAEWTQEALMGMLETLGNFVLDTIDFVTLVGCGILIILGVAGLSESKKWIGILIVVNVLVKYLF